MLDSNFGIELSKYAGFWLSKLLVDNQKPEISVTNGNNHNNNNAAFMNM